MNNLHICPPHLSHVATLPSEIQKFQYYYLYTLDYLHDLRRKQIAAVVLQLKLFTYCCLVLSIIYIAIAWRAVRLISVKKDWKHVLTQKSITLNICCDIACLTFQ